MTSGLSEGNLFVFKNRLNLKIRLLRGIQLSRVFRVNHEGAGDVDEKSEKNGKSASDCIIIYNTLKEVIN